MSSFHLIEAMKSHSALAVSMKPKFKCSGFWMYSIKNEGIAGDTLAAESGQAYEILLVGQIQW